MLIAPPRLNVRAWFALAVSGPTAALALAAAVSADGLPRMAGLWAAALLAPALTLAIRSLESRRRTPMEGLERTLTVALALSVSEGCGLLLAVLAGLPLGGEAVACGLAVAAFPLSLAVPAYVLRPAFRPLLADPAQSARAIALVRATAEAVEAAAEPDDEAAERPMTFTSRVRANLGAGAELSPGSAPWEFRPIRIWAPPEPPAEPEVPLKAQPDDIDDFAAAHEAALLELRHLLDLYGSQVATPADAVRRRRGAATPRRRAA